MSIESERQSFIDRMFATPIRSAQPGEAYEIPRACEGLIDGVLSELTEHGWAAGTEHRDSGDQTPITVRLIPPKEKES